MQVLACKHRGNRGKCQDGGDKQWAYLGGKGRLRGKDDANGVEQVSNL